MSARAAIGRPAIVLVLVLLVAQYAVGIAVNLYVVVPAHHPGARPSDYFSGSMSSVGWAIRSGPATLAIHAALGLFLLLPALTVLARAARSRRGRAVILAALGLSFIIGAGFNGASFLDYNDDLSSLIMALLFALAVVAYVSLLALESHR